jgi:purine nucleoside permease
VYASGFDLTKTYFLEAGIGGFNPEYGTVGSVSIASYVIQWGLSYEFDARDKNESWPTGFVPFGELRILMTLEFVANLVRNH